MLTQDFMYLVLTENSLDEIQAHIDRSRQQNAGDALFQLRLDRRQTEIDQQREAIETVVRNIAPNN